MKQWVVRRGSRYENHESYGKLVKRCPFIKPSSRFQHGATQWLTSESAPMKGGTVQSQKGQSRRGKWTCTSSLQNSDS